MTLIWPNTDEFIEGKIKYIGLSAISSKTLRRAYKIAPITALQVEYSLFTRDIEGPAGTNLLATYRELVVAIVCSSPLSRGLLSTTFRKGELLNDKADLRPKLFPRFQDGNREYNEKVVLQLNNFADKKGCTISQLALAWLMKQGDDIFPIPGTKQLKYLEDNLGATDVKLSDEEEAEIRAFVEKLDVVGSIIPPAFASYIFRDTKEEYGWIQTSMGILAHE